MAFANFDENETSVHLWQGEYVPNYLYTSSHETNRIIFYET